MEIIRLGTLYCDGCPIVPGGYVPSGRPILIGDTTAGYELQWIKAGNLLVADRCACIDISWVALDKLGFIYGTPVEINGKLYVCRSLKVGADDGDENEWDNLLNVFGEDDNLWHWSNAMFWGQERLPYEPMERVARGQDFARTRFCGFKGDLSSFIGFRPVLEILSPPPPDLSHLIKKEITVYGPQGTVIEGTMTGFDEYDVLIDGVPHLPDDCKWATVDGRRVTVNRESVLYLQ